MWGKIKVFLKIGVLEELEVDKLWEGSIVISFFNFLGNLIIVKCLVERKVIVFSMELIFCISRV